MILLTKILNLAKNRNLLRGIRTHSPTLSSVDRLEPCQSQRLTDIGTRRIFNSDHDIFRESVRRFYKEQRNPFREEWEKAGHSSREFWLKAGEAGLLGVSTPIEQGGLGGGWLSAVIVVEEEYCNDLCPLGLPVHSDVVMPYIAKHGTRKQIEYYIPDMVAGRKIGAIAMTEPGAGSDVQAIRTKAVRDGDSWVINGSKTFISNGYLCDVVLLAAVTNRGSKSPSHGMSLFLVDSKTPGFKRGKLLKKLGSKAYDTTELFFEDMRIPHDALLGGDAGLNKGFYIMMQELPQERLVVANVSISMSEYMFEITREYVRQRKAFGKRIADLQTIQHSLAEIKTEIAVTRAFVDRCNELHDVGKLDTSTASMAKYWASERVNSQAYRLLQMFGGYGYMWEYPIARAYVDARLQPIYTGTNEIMKELIARNIVK